MFDHRRPISSASNVIDEPGSPLPPGSPRRPSSASPSPRFERNIINDVADLEQLPDAPSEINPPNNPEVPFIIRPDTPLSCPDRLDLETSLLPVHPEAFSRMEVHQQNLIRNISLKRMRVLAAQQLRYDLEHEVGYENRRPRSELHRPPGLTPVPDGLARTVPESETIACPMCNHELATGSGLKRQTWVAKHCGHVCIPKDIGLTSLLNSLSSGLLWRVCRETATTEPARRKKPTVGISNVY
jgi:hypothetical protein